jgi:hypothetical protein
LPECETIENPDNNRNEKLSVEVRWISPILDEKSFSEFNSLCPNWRSKLVQLNARIVLGFASFALDTLNYLVDIFEFLGVQPFFVPARRISILISECFKRKEELSKSRETDSRLSFS